MQTVPRFPVQIEGNFDHAVMVNLSTVELLRNVIEQLVQLIHKRSHIHIGAHKGYRTYDSVESSEDRACL